jgi:CHAT domain-containing protein/tetratricopeptide (TPR) repeat protein
MGLRARARLFHFAWAVVFLFVIPLHDSPSLSAREAYEHALKLFQRGRLVDSQIASQQGYERFHATSPDWAARFLLLEAETLVWRGMDDKALRLLSGQQTDPNHPEETIRRLAIEASAFIHQGQLAAADQRLTQGEALCVRADYASCGAVFRTRGILEVNQGPPAAGRPSLLKNLSHAQAHHDRYLEANALLTLGWAAIQSGHLDESVDWSSSAYRAASNLGAENLAQAASGNLGWAYYQLGDDEKALENFLSSEKSAEELGNLGYQLKWMSAAGFVYRDAGDLTRATQSLRKAFELAKQLNSKQDIVNALENLAQVSVDAGRLDEASAYINQVVRIEVKDGGRLSANVMLSQGMVAAGRGQDKQAESLFRKVQEDPRNPTTTRLGAEGQLAQLLERQGNTRAAERMYRTTLADFESARAQLKREESKLPFVANAKPLYDDYLNLLVKQGRSDEALALADRSRARTLADSLGIATNNHAASAEAIDPRRIAKETGATLLFYWLGPDRSYLWAITPAKAALIPLPAQGQIIARVERYRKAILDIEDPLLGANSDGQALYNLLVAPASRLIRPGAPVVILAEGVLTQLNFETLLVPGSSSPSGSSPSPASDRGSGPDHFAPSALHYWIDDATLVSAPSLAMLAARKSPLRSDRRLLLIGNPVTASEDYPSLPLFGLEVKQIQEHFHTADSTVLSGPKANPAAYLSSNPAQYSYIHFVSHAIASRTDPLDSAIILSGSTTGDGSYKLYARDIMQHPIHARLVTVSACSTSGTRTYAGEGLVGLSWAFLHAGSESVIGALWEVADESSPRLMNTLYQGIEDGKTPAEALRLAKISLIRANGSFGKPFFWAPFQVYAR